MGMDIPLRQVPIFLIMHGFGSFNLVRTRRLFCSFILLITLMCVISVYPPHNAFGMSSSGLIVPLYSYPGTMWDELVQEKNTHYSVPIMAIINPSNGPGIRDENYVTGVHDLQNSGIVVLGYVDTGYGSKNATTIESEMNSYKNWYGVNGIFFDTMSSVPGKEIFYKHLSDYAKSIGLTYTVGNPGTDTSPSYIGTVDNIVIYDNKGLPPLSLFEGWHENFAKSNFSFLSYDVSNLNKTYVDNVTKYVQYLYITDLTLPNPFVVLSSQIDELVSSIETGGQNGGTVSVNLNTYSDDDKPLDGLWTIVKSDKNATTGFSPFSFSAIAGQQYNITVANFHNYVFDHWDDGTTKNTRVIVPTQNVTLTAYYATNQTIPNQTNSTTVSNQTNSTTVSNQTSAIESTPSQLSSYQGQIVNQMKNVGSVIVNTMYPNGDRADYTILSFTIYQDTNQSLYRRIDSVPGNPFYIGNLPLGHSYKVEAFVNGMCADIEYVTLAKTAAQLNVFLPNPVGMRLDVLYEDGVTPISNAIITVKSQDNKTQATSNTDINGESLRFWLEPTSQNNWQTSSI